MFGERLKELRSQREMSQQELADALKIARSTLASYEVGDREPDFETAGRLADFLGVSVDYLLGRTDDPAPPGAKPKPAQHTNQEFRAFLRGRKLSDKDIELILQLEERMRREDEEKKKGQD